MHNGVDEHQPDLEPISLKEVRELFQMYGGTDWTPPKSEDIEAFHQQGMARSLTKKPGALFTPRKQLVLIGDWPEDTGSIRLAHRAQFRAAGEAMKV